MVRILSFAALRYSIGELILKAPIGLENLATLHIREMQGGRRAHKGLPYPLTPIGGNLAYFTAASASSTVETNGTIIPWAPASRAPFHIYCQSAKDGWERGAVVYKYV